MGFDCANAPHSCRCLQRPGRPRGRGGPGAGQQGPVGTVATQEHKPHVTGAAAAGQHDLIRALKSFDPVSCVTSGKSLNISELLFLRE